jgi:GNAT superfamily N-acetyltransferase
MPSSLTLRKATIHDLPAVLKLYEQPAIDDGVSLSLEKAREIFSRIERYPSYSLYVAVLKEQVVGSFALLIMDNLGHLGAPSAIVEDVVVDPHYEQRGFGKRMMKMAISNAANAGCYKISLSANFKRKEAHQFYESLGFEKHGYSYKIPLYQQNNSKI